MAEAAAQMGPGQLVGPIEVPGGVSIMLMVDRRQVLTADPRDALLSLKQISLDFPAGTTPAQATDLASKFTTATGAISGRGAADKVAQSLGAQIGLPDHISILQLPSPLQPPLPPLPNGPTPQPTATEPTAPSALVL